MGNPDDTRESIEANLTFAQRYIEWPYIQHQTPYPGTPMTQDFETRALIVNDQLEDYDGTTAVVKTAALEADEIEFLRWRAERWMKLGHFPVALGHSPRFVMPHELAMLHETFRGSSVRSWLGLEGDRVVFDRYRRLRRPERASIWQSLGDTAARTPGRRQATAA